MIRREEVDLLVSEIEFYIEALKKVGTKPTNDIRVLPIWDNSDLGIF